MIEERIVEADGYRWAVHPNSDDHLALGGHETALEPILRSMLEPGKDFVNVGAHVGLWAIRLADRADIVYAFEANPRTAETLTKNVTLNELEDKVSVIPRAVYSDCETKFNLVDVNDVDTGGSTRIEPDENGSVATTTVTLDSYELDNVGLISIDVEGAEAHVLRGAFETIMRNRPNLEIELHEGHPGTEPDLREHVYFWLDKMNYRFNSVDITGERLLCFPQELESDDPQTDIVVDDGSGTSLETDSDLLALFQQ